MTNGTSLAVRPLPAAGKPGRLLHVVSDGGDSVMIEARSLAVGDRILAGRDGDYTPAVVVRLGAQLVQDRLVHCLDWDSTETVPNGMPRSIGRAFYRPGDLVTRLAEAAVTRG